MLFERKWKQHIVDTKKEKEPPNDEDSSKVQDKASPKRTAAVFENNKEQTNPKTVPFDGMIQCTFLNDCLL